MTGQVAQFEPDYSPKDGKIEELPVENKFSLFISNTTDFYSTKLTKVDDITFKIKYYDNSKGKNLEDFFMWDGDQFISIAS